MIEENEKEFQRQLEMQQTSQDDFSLAGIIEGIRSIEMPKSSIFYSLTTICDFLTIFLTLLCGIYTLWLFG
jgi:hypothetical protein